MALADFPYRDHAPSANLAQPRREILVGAAKYMVNQLGIARAALDTAFHCRTDEQKAASQHACPFHNISEDWAGACGLELRHMNTTFNASECLV
jgi:predicted ArsR family transcriptional regulator